MQENTQSEKEIIILTGLSGAGMSTAAQVFEDMNFFSADGVPAALMPEFIRLIHEPDMRHFRGIVLGIDLKRKYLTNPSEELLPVLGKIKQQCPKTTLIFLEADKDSILKRYASTRRPHPLEQEGYTLESAMEEEKNRLQSVRSLADFIINTSEFSLHDLRRYLQKHFSKTLENSHSMWITIMSFGYKFGIPKDTDLVFDMRCLPNPFFDPKLKQFTGLNKEVADYIFKDGQAREFREELLRFILKILPHYDNEGRYRLCIGIGCTGGCHRSVAMTEYLAKALTQNGYNIIKEHKNLPKNSQSGTN